MRLWKTFQRSGFYGNGLIELTKNVNHEETPAFVKKLVELVRFPCILRVDAHGFVREKADEITGFQFASQNSAIQLSNEKNHVLMTNEETVRPVIDYFDQMTGQEFLGKWYESHDRIAELASSGFLPSSTKSVVVYLEPVNMTATEIFGANK